MTQLEEANTLIMETGEVICDVIEQMLKGNWVDDQGHKVHLNIYMQRMPDQLNKLADYRDEYLGGEYYG